MKNKYSLFLTTISIYLSAVLLIIACEKPIDDDTSTITKKEFTVTFDANQGKLSGVASVKVEEGKQVAKPTNPTRTDYSFVEWRKKDDISAFNFSDAITADITLVAKWTNNKVFTVTFDANQGTLSGAASVKVEEGKQVAKPTNPTRTNYSFVEWRKKDDISAFNFSDAITADITLVAAWNTNLNTWVGPKMTFTKADGANPSDEANQDRITDKVWLTRGNSGGQIYNIVTETVANKANSPLGTEWAFGKISDGVNELDFKKFRDLGKPKTFVGRDMVLHLIEDDIYIDLKISSYSGGKQGGFTYERSTKE